MPSKRKQRDFSARDIVNDTIRRSLDKVEATDAAKRDAIAYNVDLTGINGTGKGGRIIQKDVRNYLRPLWEGQGTPAGTPPLNFNNTGNPMVESMATIAQAQQTSQIDAQMARGLARPEQSNAFPPPNYDPVKLIEQTYDSVRNQHKDLQDRLDNALAKGLMEKRDVARIFRGDASNMTPETAQANRRTLEGRLQQVEANENWAQQQLDARRNREEALAQHYKEVIHPFITKDRRYTANTPFVMNDRGEYKRDEAGRLIPYNENVLGEAQVRLQKDNEWGVNINVLPSTGSPRPIASIPQPPAWVQDRDTFNPFKELEQKRRQRSEAQRAYDTGDELTQNVLEGEISRLDDHIGSLQSYMAKQSQSVSPPEPEIGTLFINGQAMRPTFPGVQGGPTPTSLSTQETLFSALFSSGRNPNEMIMDNMKDNDEYSASWHSLVAEGAGGPAALGKLRRDWHIPDTYMLHDKAEPEITLTAGSHVDNPYHQSIIDKLKPGDKRILKNREEFLTEFGLVMRKGSESTGTMIQAYASGSGTSVEKDDQGNDIVYGIGESDLQKANKRFRLKGQYEQEFGALGELSPSVDERRTTSQFVTANGDIINSYRMRQLRFLGSAGGTFGEGQGIFNIGAERNQNKGVWQPRVWEFDLPKDDKGNVSLSVEARAQLESQRGTRLESGTLSFGDQSFDLGKNWENSWIQDTEITNEGKLMIRGGQGGAAMSNKNYMKEFLQFAEAEKFVGLDNANDYDLLGPITGDPLNVMYGALDVMRPNELNDFLSKHMDTLRTQAAGDEATRGYYDQQVEVYKQEFFDDKGQLKPKLSYNSRTVPLLAKAFTSTYLSERDENGNFKRVKNVPVTQTVHKNSLEQYLSGRSAESQHIIDTHFGGNKDLRDAFLDKFDVRPVEGQPDMFNVTSNHIALDLEMGANFRSEMSGPESKMNDSIRRARQTYGDAAELGALSVIGGDIAGQAGGLIAANLANNGVKPGSAMNLSDVDPTKYQSIRDELIASHGENITSTQVVDARMQALQQTFGSSMIGVPNGASGDINYLASPDAMQRFSAFNDTGEQVGLIKGYSDLIDAQMDQMSTGEPAGADPQELAKLLQKQAKEAETAGVRSAALGGGRTPAVGYLYNTNSKALDANEITMHHARAHQLVKQGLIAQGVDPEEAHAAAHSILNSGAVFGSTRNPSLDVAQANTNLAYVSPSQLEDRGGVAGRLFRNQAVTSPFWSAHQRGDVDADALSAFWAGTVQKDENGQIMRDEQGQIQFKQAEATPAERIIQEGQNAPGGEFRNQLGSIYGPKYGDDLNSLTEKFDAAAGRAAQGIPATSLEKASAASISAASNMGEFYNWGRGFEVMSGRMGYDADQQAEYGKTMSRIASEAYQPALDEKRSNRGINLLQRLHHGSVVTGYDKDGGLLFGTKETTRTGNSVNLHKFSEKIFEGFLTAYDPKDEKEGVSSAEAAFALSPSNLTSDQRQQLTEGIEAGRTKLRGITNKDEYDTTALDIAKGLHNQVRKQSGSEFFLESNAPATLFAAPGALKSLRKDQEFRIGKKPETGPDNRKLNTRATPILENLATKGAIIESAIAVEGKQKLDANDLAQSTRMIGPELIPGNPQANSQWEQFLAETGAPTNKMGIREYVNGTDSMNAASPLDENQLRSAPAPVPVPTSDVRVDPVAAGHATDFSAGSVSVGGSVSSAGVGATAGGNGGFSGGGPGGPVMMQFPTDDHGRPVAMPVTIQTAPKKLDAEDIEKTAPLWGAISSVDPGAKLAHYASLPSLSQEQGEDVLRLTKNIRQFGDTMTVAANENNVHERMLQHMYGPEGYDWQNTSVGAVYNGLQGIPDENGSTENFSILSELQARAGMAVGQGKRGTTEDRIKKAEINKRMRSNLVEVRETFRNTGPGAASMMLNLVGQQYTADKVEAGVATIADTKKWLSDADQEDAAKREIIAQTEKEKKSAALDARAESMTDKEYIDLARHGSTDDDKEVVKRYDKIRSQQSKLNQAGVRMARADYEEDRNGALWASKVARTNAPYMQGLDAEIAHSYASTVEKLDKASNRSAQADERRTSAQQRLDENNRLRGEKTEALQAEQEKIAAFNSLTDPQKQAVVAAAAANKVDPAKQSTYEKAIAAYAAGDRDKTKGDVLMGKALYETMDRDEQRSYRQKVRGLVPGSPEYAAALAENPGLAHQEFNDYLGGEERKGLAQARKAGFGTRADDISVGRASALGDSLQDLTKIMEKLTGTSRGLTEQEAKTVKVHGELLDDLKTRIDNAQQIVQSGSDSTDEQKDAAQNYLNRIAAQKFDVGGRTLNGLQAVDELSGIMEGEGGATELAEKRRQSDRLSIQKPTLNEKLQPFMQRGRAGQEARQKADEAGWYGEGAENVAWHAIGSAIAVPNFLLQNRYAIRGIQQEFLGPMSQARDAYLASQQSQTMVAVGTDAFGGGNLVGTGAYNRAVMPGVLQAQEQLAFGEQSNRVIGGFSNAVSGALGTNAAGAAHALANTVLAGGGMGGLIGGPVGAAIGAGIGGSAFLVSQALSYNSDEQERNDFHGHIQDYLSGRDRNIADVVIKDPSAFVGYALNHYVSGKPGEGGLGIGTDQYNAQESQAASVARDADQLAHDTVSPDDLARMKKDYGVLHSLGTRYLDEHQTGGNLDPTIRRNTWTKTMAMFGLDRWNAPRGHEKFGGIFQWATQMVGAGVDPFEAASSEAEFQGVASEDTESNGFLNAFGNAAGAFFGENGVARTKLSKRFAQQQAGIADLARRGGMNSYLHPLSPDDMAKIQKRADDETDPALRANILREGIQKNEADTTLAQMGMAGSDLGTVRSYSNYINGLSQDTSEAGARAFNKQMQRTGAELGMQQQFQYGLGGSAKSAGDIVTQISQATAGYSAQAESFATQTMLRSGFKGIGADTLANFAQISDAGLDGEFQQRVASAAAGKNLVYGSKDYRAEVKRLADEFHNNPDVAGYIQSTGEDRDRASYNWQARATGMRIQSDDFMQGYTEQQRQMSIGAQGAVANVRAVTGNRGDDFTYNKLQTDIAFATTPDDYFNANRRISQLGQASSKVMSYAAYQSQAGLDKIQSVLDSAAYNMSGPQFQQTMAILGGDPIANSLAADQGMVSQNRRLVQTGASGGSLGMQAGYDEKISSFIAGERGQIASSRGLVHGNASYSASQLSSMNQVQIETAMNAEQYKMREYDFGLAQTQMNRQNRATTTNWGFEDQGIAMQRSQQDWGFGQEQRQLDLSRSQSNTTYDYQKQNMNVQRSHQVQEQQWGLQDMDYQRNMSEMSFGFNMIDADESVRYSRGRDRRVAMRHRDEATVMHSMEMGHMDTEEERAKTRIKWGDEQFSRDKAHFDQDRQFQIQSQQLAQENHNKQVEFAHQERQLDDEKRQFNRMISREEMAEAQASLTAHQNSKRVMDDLAGSITAANSLYEQNKNALSYITTTGQDAVTTLQAVAAKLAILAQSPLPTGGGGGSFGSTAGPSGNIGSPAVVTSMVGGADGQWHPVNTYTSASITQQPMAITSVAHPDGTTSYHGFAEGGYTGAGPKYQEAGAVHKGEWVIPQAGSPVVMSPETVAVLREIRDILKNIHADGANAVIMMPESQPAKAMNKLNTLYNSSWSQ